MKFIEKNRMRLLCLLAIFCLCCIAMVPAVGAAQNKWITNNVTVYANNSYYATIGGVNWTNAYFFGVTGNGHYNTTAPAWNWTQNATYTNRYYMEQLKVGNAWYPASVDSTYNYEWDFIDQFGMNATIYKKALGGYVNPASGTYYAWYGNRTAANTYYDGMSDWMVPTYQNATYLVNLTEVWQ